MNLVKVFIGVVALFACASLTAAQSTRQPQPPANDSASPFGTQVGSIRGRVVLEGGTFLAQAARVTLLDMRGVQAAIYTDNQGQFEITNLSPGQYTLEVEGDRLLFEIASERVDVRRGMPSIVTITLKEKSSDGSSRSAAPVASVGELSSDIPAKARAEFEHASKAAKEGKTDEAIAHLRRAIEVYPNFLMAHNDLGAQLLEQGKLDEAAAELQQALQIDPKAFNPNLNMGIVLVKQRRYTEAAEILRKAIALQSTSPSAHLYLGLALNGIEDSTGAEAELKLAYANGGAAYAIALFQLGELYMNRGDRMLARQAFELYLRQSPNAANAAQARQLISVLR